MCWPTQLNNETVIIKDLDVQTQVKDIDLTVVDVYLTKFAIPILVNNVNTCVGSVCG